MLLQCFHIITWPVPTRLRMAMDEPQSVLLSSLSAAMIAGKSSIGAASDTPLGATSAPRYINTRRWTHIYHPKCGFDTATSPTKGTPSLRTAGWHLCPVNFFFQLSKVSNSDSQRDLDSLCESRESKEIGASSDFRHNHQRGTTAKALGQRSLVWHVPAEAPFVIGPGSHKQGRGSVQSFGKPRCEEMHCVLKRGSLQLGHQ